MADHGALRPETILQHLGESTKPYGAVAPPLVQTSLFVFDSVDDFWAGEAWQLDTWKYSRLSNPTVELAEKKIAALEHTEAAKLFASGMAAISAAILSCVNKGDHIVAVDSIYGPTRMFLNEMLPRFGVEATFVVGEDPEDFVRACRPNTKLFCLESPTSIIFRMQDLEAVVAIARERGITTMIDNSYSSPIMQTPADFGIDMVVHSATKYFGGFSDTVAGVVAGKREKLSQIMYHEGQLLGGCIAPFNAWLILRSLRTLAIKVRAHAETANTLAAWVKEQKWAARLYHVGDSDYPQAELRDRQMKGSAGLICFQPVVQDVDTLKTFVESLELFQLGVSWGGHESLAVPLTFQPMDWPEPKWLVRLFCGLEHADDLIADLNQAALKVGWY